MVHAIEVQLGANIDKYKAGMDAAKRTGTESLGFITSIFDKIKSMFSGLWDSFKSFFSGFGDKSKSTFDSMSSSASGAFQKLSGYFSGLNSSLGQTNAKMDETEQKSSSLTSKIGIGLVAAFVAVTAVVSAMVAKGLMVDATFAGIATSSDLAVSQISRFDAAAARSGVGIKDLGSAMAKFRDQMKSAAAGDGSDEFSKLGVKVADSNNALRKTDDVMIDVAKKIAGMSSEAEKYAAASKLGFDGKVQVLEDIAHASDLSSRVTDEQAAAATRLGKIWHEILPSGRSMWTEISDKLTNAFTPAMTTASIAILEAKNKIVDAFNQIYGGGSMFDKIATKIQAWSKDASKWFADVTKSATDLTISLAKYIAIKTGLGNGDASKPNGAGYVPGQVPLASGKNDPIVSTADKEAADAAQRQYDQLTKSIKEKTAAQQLEAQTGAALTDGQRTALQLMTLIGTDTVKLTDDEKRAAAAQVQSMLTLEQSNKAMLDGKAAAEAAAKKEGEAYAALIATIHDKIAQDKLQLLTDDSLTDSQKLLIKLDAELASGKIKLSAAHITAAKAAIEELGVNEDLIKAQTVQKDVIKYIESGVNARNKSIEALHLEYQAYGKSADARAIAMVAIESEASMQAELTDKYNKHLPVNEAIITQLERERDARTQVGQATLAQTQALNYAAQLAQDNKQFAVDSILDDKQRAAAQLALDSQVWQERIRLAGDGTEAQKILQQQFDQWYRNQSIKPALDEQKQMWDSIESAAHDTFLSIENGAKSAGQRAKEALKNGLFEWLWQLAAKPIYLDVRASFSSAGSSVLGAGSGASSAMGAAGGNPLVAAAQAASTVYSAISASFSTLGTTVADAVQAGMYSTGMTSQIASNGAFATGAGSFAGGAAGALAGHYVGNAIAGDYSINHGEAVTNIASVVGAVIGGPIGGAIGGAIGGLINRAFGMGSTQVKSQGMSGTLTADSLAGNAYQNLHQNGGWFRSDKNWQNTTAFDAQTVAQFTQGLSAIEQASSGFAKSLGVDAGWISTYSKTFDITLTGDATKDAQAVTDFFAGVGDELANKLIPNLAQLSKNGETASATLQRLAGEFQGTDQVAQMLGTSAAQLFGSAGLDSAKARENLINAAGGLDVLSQQATSFNQNFLTDAQRIKPVADALNAALGSLGLDTIPTTRDQFAALVVKLRDSGAAATEEGAKQLDSLLALAPAFAQVYAAGRSAADILSERQGLQDQLDQLTMTSTQLLMKQRDALDASNQALLDQVQAAQRAKDIATERATLQDQYDQLTMTSTQLAQKQRDALDASNLALFDQIQAINAQAAAAQAAKDAIQAAKDTATGLLGDVDNAFTVLQNATKSTTDSLNARISAEKALSDAIKSTLGSMTAASTDLTDRMAAQAQIKTALAIAKAGGPLPTAESLQGALSTVSKDDSAKFASQADYLKDLYSTKNDLSQLGDLADSSLSVDQQQLDSLNAMLAADQQQIDLLKGIANALTIQQAQAGFQTAVTSAQANPVVAANSGISGLYQSLLGRAPDAAGLAYWQNAAANGMSLDTIAADMKNSSEYKHLQGIPGFAGGGDHGGGWRMVGENGPELESTGPSRIFNASQTSDIFARLSSSSSNNDALLAELKANRQETALLRQEVSALRVANSAENLAIAKSSAKSADALDGAVNGVRPLVTASQPG